MSKDTFTFQHFSLLQLKVLTWWINKDLVDKVDGIIADGAIRSGKTLSMSLSFIRWAMTNFTNQDFAMCGKTIGTFRKNVWKNLKRHLLAQGFSVVESHNENMIQITKGNQTNRFYIYGGKDERSQDLIQGATLAGVFFDEVALMPESFVNQATARCSVEGAKYWFNCNPEHSMHWFKKNWIDKRDSQNLLYCHFNLDDNPSLSEKKKEQYRNRYTGVFFRRYINGEWCVAEGLVYDNFDVEKDPIEKVPENLTGRRYISCDYGTQNPSVFLLWEEGVSGTWYLTEEYYYSGRATGKQKTDSEYVNDFIRFVDGRSIERVIVDPSAASFIAALRKEGFKILKAKNDVVDGIRYTATQLHLGKVKILKSCKHTIEEFGVYSWNDKKEEDVPVKEMDHAMDALRYFCYTVLSRKKRKGIKFLK